jgi:chaperone modulatory protein CbpM
MTTQKYEIILSRKHIIVAVSGITIAELSRLSACHPTVNRRLLAIGLIDPLSPGDEPLFDRSVVVRTRKALRLKRDLELNLNCRGPHHGTVGQDRGTGAAR